MITRHGADTFEERGSNHILLSGAFKRHVEAIERIVVSAIS